MTLKRLGLAFLLGATASLVGFFLMKAALVVWYVHKYGVHALNPDWARRQKDVLFEDKQFACVLNASLASGI